MIIKVCGMRQRENIAEIASIKTDWMGFIFYPKSKRYVGVAFSSDALPAKSTGIRTVAVFVNEHFETVQQIVKKYHFDMVQLHGSESPEYCQAIKHTVKVIKAFGLEPGFDWTKLKPYLGCCDYFLFDTSTPGHGGSGQKFSWQMLDEYQYSTPFLLSGGIGPNDANVLKSIHHPQLAGIDVNSCFEIEPALKNIELLKQFINRLRS
jgi:phosphoribosylanthranilate isomerase